ncbi:MAG: TerC family protein [Flavobacteriales bacterium]|nr:TerC family protein [Flavobacteriales bacterium]
MDHLFTLEALTGLLALTVMEILLGIDNVIFVSIIMNRLPAGSEKKAGIIWMISGAIIRIILLFSLGWLIETGGDLFSIFEHHVGLKDLIMIGGGLFLLVSTTKEIHNKLEGEDPNLAAKQQDIKKSFGAIMLQIVLIDVIFSIDGVITAIGMASEFMLQVIAIAISLFVMFIFAPKISKFIHKHPTFKMLALSFLILIAVLLLVEGVHVDHFEVPKGYIYFAMAFSFGVEILNTVARKNSKNKPVELHEPRPE